MATFLTNKRQIKRQIKTTVASTANPARQIRRHLIRPHRLTHRPVPRARRVLVPVECSCPSSARARRVLVPVECSCPSSARARSVLVPVQCPCPLSARAPHCPCSRLFVLVGFACPWSASAPHCPCSRLLVSVSEHARLPMCKGTRGGTRADGRGPGQARAQQLHGPGLGRLAHHRNTGTARARLLLCTVRRRRTTSRRPVRCLPKLAPQLLRLARRCAHQRRRRISEAALVTTPRRNQSSRATAVSSSQSQRCVRSVLHVRLGSRAWTSSSTTTTTTTVVVMMTTTPARRRDGDECDEDDDDPRASISLTHHARE